jgi:aryl-alcohol dehydrogenase-like predicted oxidoreductase
LPLGTNQIRYNLLYRKIETDGTLDTDRELGVTITAYTPLGSGLLTGKYHKNPELLKNKSGSLGISVVPARYRAATRATRSKITGTTYR